MSRRLEESFSIEVTAILSGTLGSAGKATRVVETIVMETLPRRRIKVGVKASHTRVGAHEHRVGCAV